MVDQFRDQMQNIAMGLPLISLQCARISESKDLIGFFK
jgi:hypothetical protein